MALLFAALALTGCTSTTSAAAPEGPLAAPEGFRVALEHDEDPAPGPNGAGKVQWRTDWRLTWDEVPGADRYEVRYGTNEGARDAPGDFVEGESLTVEAAAGTSTAERLEQDRRAGLLFTSSQLLVSVRAVGGEQSPWFPVGDAPPDGVPLGTAQVGHDEGEQAQG